MSVNSYIAGAQSALGELQPLLRAFRQRVIKTTASEHLPGKQLRRIVDAVEDAEEGSTLLVHSLEITKITGPRDNW